MFSSCRAARVFTADEAPADRIVTHPDIQPTSLRIRCNSHDLSHFGICERDRLWSDTYEGWDGVFAVGISGDGQVAAAGRWCDKNRGLLRIYDGDAGRCEFDLQDRDLR